MDPYVPTWEDIAKEKQQEWYEIFGDRDWDKYETSSRDIPNLMQNVGHALYGLPDEEPETSNFNTGYREVKLNHIQNICEIIKKHNVHKNATYKEVFIGIIFVYLKTGVGDYSHIPAVVFRVMKDGCEDHTNVFIDSDCRVYMGWADYLKNNKLPKCTYCYPRNGVYYGDDHDEVYVDFGITPAAAHSRKVLNIVDIAGTVLAVGVTLVSASTMAVPVAAPVLLGTIVGGVAVGFYGIVHNVITIVDLKTHDQSISLNDSNARCVWFSLGANTLGMVAAGATKMASAVARSGNVLGKGGRFAVNAAQVSAIAANGINIVNTGFFLRDKSKTESLTPLDIFQFSASVLFFTNSVVNLKSAKTIMRESQQNVIQDFKSKLRSNIHMKTYARLARNTRSGLDAMHGDAKVIRGIVNISNPDDFFSGIVRSQKQFSKHQAEVKFSDSGHISINNELIVDPSKFSGIEKSQRSVILEASRQHAVGEITTPQLQASVNPILIENGLPSIDSQSVSKLCNAFGVKSLTEVKLGGMNILSNIQPNDIEFLLRLSAKPLSPQILTTAKQIAEKLYLNNVRDFLGFLEYFIGRIKKLVIEMESAYVGMVNIAKTFPGFNQTQFDSDNGIAVNREEHFINVILKLQSVGKGFMELRQAYTEYYLQRKAGASKDETTKKRQPGNQLELAFDSNYQSDLGGEKTANKDLSGFRAESFSEMMISRVPLRKKQQRMEIN